MLLTVDIDTQGDQTAGQGCVGDQGADLSILVHLVLAHCGAFVRLSNEVGKREKNGVVVKVESVQTGEGYVCAVFFGDRGVSEGDLAK